MLSFSILHSIFSKLKFFENSKKYSSHSIHRRCVNETVVETDEGICKTGANEQKNKACNSRSSITLTQYRNRFASPANLFFVIFSRIMGGIEEQESGLPVLSPYPLFTPFCSTRFLSAFSTCTFLYISCTFL